MKKAFAFLISNSILLVLIVRCFYTIYSRKYKRLEDNYERACFQNDVLRKWNKNKQAGKKIETYFEKRNIECIAIYGMGKLGELLYEELKDSSICIACIIDRDTKSSAYRVLSIDDNIPIVDAVVITPIHNEISRLIESKHISKRILGLDEVVYNL